MVYSIAWDETQPDGSENANTIDTELQELKESIRERMNNILDSTTAWETDGDDPKLLDGAAFPAGDITYAARASERAYVSLNANEVITTSTDTPIPWDVEDVDVGDLVNLDGPGAQPTRITIVNTGFYLVIGNIGWDAQVTGYRNASIYINGGASVPSTSIVPTIPTSVDQGVFWMGVLTAADYLTLQVFHTQGVNASVQSGAQTNFSCVRLA
jgi:hypothetical protein